MESLERNLIVVRLLNKVYSDGAYSAIELNKALSELKDERDRAYVTRLFYGALSKHTQLDYVLSRLTSKRPKQIVRIVLEVGIYMLRFMDMPDYAVISTQVSLIKKLGKRELAGFVNAVLRSSSNVVLPIKDKDKTKELSVNYSCPEWIIRRLTRERGVEFVEAYLSAELTSKTHVRLNKRRIDDEAFVKKIPGAVKSPCGYYVSGSELKRLQSDEYTVQSLSSALAAEYYASGVKQGDEILDLCAAPGGKAVYLSYLTGGMVTACDIHPHRVELIRSYAKRMGEPVEAVVNDATIMREDFIDRFGCVVCDVPCSGLGVIYSKPDVLLFRKEEDIRSLVELQKSIISTAARYVKLGGSLNYSTCTILREENEGVVNAFLEENDGFELIGDETKNVKADGDGFVRLYPQSHACDGFFVAKLRRIK